MPIHLNYYQIAPKAIAAQLGLEQYLSSADVSPSISKTLLELIKIRVSQINQCAYCIDMHTKDARANGESEQRIFGLSAWESAPFYTEEERATLAWCEAITKVAPHEDCHALLNTMRNFFDDKTIVDLCIAICSINNWNRITLAFGADVGSYQVGQFEQHSSSVST
ncbi:carboxymuconolactone decarboxylase family protein [Thalassotalea sp. 1_MG-2023]|uniref:carboxymuconolactone decarboxylase family protein n=1 Tax=Thalassotalea sp. 1_MG-2023 TaxID=3062680 RepID=UPI0026E3A53B|nr:carboxymuconolactone decarboxylase family protein [Thalassotalea sp. 1_MG-2023]MDO6427929.1 carboxymuconolactone decarboxylase family protein [Thalassotalea sp. 1_MG-2023]